MRSSPLRARSERVAAGLPGSASAARPGRRFEVAEPRPVVMSPRSFATVRSRLDPVGGDGSSRCIHARPSSTVRRTRRKARFSTAFIVGHSLVRHSDTRRGLAFSLPNTTRQPPRMRPDKASAIPASDRRVSTRAETTSRFRGRQDSGRVEIVNHTLTAASQSLSAARIATCGAVQAFWFVV